jgi:hypothetical protein
LLVSASLSLTAAATWAHCFVGGDQYRANAKRSDICIHMLEACLALKPENRYRTALNYRRCL